MRAAFDLSLYLVLDPVQCGGHDAALAVARAALEGGATLVQLRAPEWHKRAWFDLARELAPLARAHGVPFVVNDHVDVALAVGADGVHIGQRDLPAEIARRLLGPDALIGLSVSNLDETAEADARAGIVDYLGAGPVYATPTKTDASAPCGIDGLAAIRAATRLPTVAIGGIQAHNAAEVMRAEPAGLAVVSAICKAPDPREAAASLAATIAQSRN
ncbi:MULTISPECIES: thiamine phosphate synthase [unclassified Caballeronia]|uniref:thiamine phosphate synthase n=1 Tax=unclassified Caballeronia TaxID=2646786 RepID=UPI001F186EEA|nr:MULTISPECIES: thiamine phosphate synthase [unclassified Caballeronia]MCE4542087.1 thiamine phosphate synthase [Caballeronia sp. PC1]MCE4568867.1 thiamine phosphate synthase [Caballeronia sp. CLC5]